MGFDGDYARDAQDEYARDEWSQEREDAMDERVNQALRRWVEGMERALEALTERRER